MQALIEQANKAANEYLRTGSKRALAKAEALNAIIRAAR